MWLDFLASSPYSLLPNLRSLHLSCASKQGPGMALWRSWVDHIEARGLPTKRAYLEPSNQVCYHLYSSIIQQQGLFVDLMRRQGNSNFQIFPYPKHPSLDPASAEMKSPNNYRGPPHRAELHWFPNYAASRPAIVT